MQAARLSVVMEDPIKKGKAKKVLDMQQLAKMEKYIRKNALKVILLVYNIECSLP